MKFSFNYLNLTVVHVKGILRYRIRQTCILFLVFAVVEANAQPARQPRPIVLTAEDTAAFPSAPQAFDQKRENIARGKTDSVYYESKTVGNRRRMLIYTPPGFFKK